jgi:hypothetical protein
MLRKLRRLSELSVRELLVFLQLALFALSARVGLRFVALPRLTAFVGWGATKYILRSLPLFHSHYRIERLAHLADLAARGTRADGPCLIRSLLLFWILRARGQRAELLIGIRKEALALNSHAWVESQGKVIGDNVAMISGFARLLSF